MNVEIKSQDAAYIAGLMDGEGCFTIIKSNATNTPIKTQYGLRVEFAMCDFGPIDLMATLFDRPIGEQTLPSGRTAYRINIHASKAAAFIRCVLPYLRGKRDQAELCLRLFDVLPGRGKSHTEESVAKIEALRKELYYLKRPHLLRC